MAKRIQEAEEKANVVSTVDADDTSSSDNSSYEDEIGIIELDDELEDIPDFVRLPATWYRAEIREVKIAQGQKRRYYDISLLIPPESYPVDYDVDNAPEGTPIHYRRVMYPDPRSRRDIDEVKKFMKVLGLPLATKRIDHTQWEGRWVKVRLSYDRTYQGRPVAEITALEKDDV